MKLSGIDKGIRTYKRYISEFLISVTRDQVSFEVNGVMVKSPNAFYSESTNWIVLIIPRLPYVGLLDDPYVGLTQ